MSKDDVIQMQGEIVDRNTLFQDRWFERGIAEGLLDRRVDRASAGFLLDAVASYTRRRFQVGATAENLLNVKWNQAQFATETRLRTEPMGTSVDELHFTPGTPFYAKLNVSVFF